MKVGIIGTGNIGTDLLVKVMRSTVLECGIFAGHNRDSKGIAFAHSLGVSTTFDSIDYIISHPDCCSLVFDATSASVHRYNAPILAELGKPCMDLTPAHLGPFCVPTVNMDSCIGLMDVNFVTCGGQATIPIACALKRVLHNISYLEIVATIASKSAGAGTRANIDEFTQTTRDALSEFSGIGRTKAIIILNPAEPPINMRCTVYALADNPNMEAVQEAVQKTEAAIKKYVPGYAITLGPLYRDGRLVISLEVKGRGDYLPPYAGNLDIITSAAVHVAEAWARKQMTSQKAEVKYTGCHHA